MAVLKSFELNGNKKSFANWISNLSPVSTPFTAMIGKEKIDQTQYSWQTDSLAPATSETFQEGSQATYQPRAATKTFTNFTSIVRKAAKVSDTNECTHAYGRRDEMAYQMGKAGKELLRDIEYMNLSSTSEATKGTSTQASRHAGFTNLCAELYVPDTDTFAMTHQGVAIVDPKAPWFALKDIFRVTTDLYVSGSKADKIMFHPKHIKVFSDKLGYNEEDAAVYRLFKGMDDKFNMQVAKIKDPLGRMYTLIPNRLMPEDAVYIFTEEDWTQMVLRTPARTELSKKGSYSSTMVEAEVGLRHRHPYASGVLKLYVVSYKTTLTADKNKLTAFIPNEANIRFYAEDTAGTATAGVDVQFKGTDPKIIQLESTEEATGNDGSVSIKAKPVNPGKTVVYGYSEKTDRHLLTEPVVLEVVAPTIEFSLTETKTQVFKDQTLKIHVQDADGNPVPDNTTVYVSADEGLGKLGPTSSEAVITNGVGVFQMSPREIGKFHIRVAFSQDDDAWTSYPFEIEVVDNDYQLSFAAGTETVLTLHIDATQSVAITLKDGDKVVSGEDIHVKSTNTNVVAFTADTYRTNDQGVATTQMGLEGIGEATIIATYKNKSISTGIRVGAGILELSVNKPKLEIGDPDGAIVTGQIVKANGQPANKPGLTVNWGTEPNDMDISFASTSSTTDSNGQVSVKVTDNVEPTKGKIGGYWTQNAELVYVDFEVIPTQYRIEFQESELSVVGGLGDETNVTVRLVHPWADVQGHTLDFSSSSTTIANWTNKTGVTDHLGYISPSNTFTADDFGTVTMTVRSEDTTSTTEAYEPGTLRVNSLKPIASMTANFVEMLVGDSGEITVTLEQPSSMGSGVISYPGKLKVLANREGISLDSEEVQFVQPGGTGGRGTIKYTALKTGTWPITVALMDGTNLSQKGNTNIRVVPPTLRVTTSPEKYTRGQNVMVHAYLTKPTGSTADLYEKEIEFTVVPDNLPGLASGTKVKTDMSGNARITTSVINSNSDYEIVATFNGTASEPYNLVEDA